jgi:hypothetical protein
MLVNQKLLDCDIIKLFYMNASHIILARNSSKSTISSKTYQMESAGFDCSELNAEIEDLRQRVCTCI